MATRIAYALILLINSIISWVMLTDWAMRKLQHVALDYVDIKCAGKDCYGWVAVHRFNFALSAFHAMLAIMLLGVRNTRDGRAKIQNGFWGPKIIAWAGLVVLTFFIPDTFFMAWGNYVAFFGAMLFVLLGLILLVDLAHTWAEYSLAKIEDESEGNHARLWRILLVGSTVGMYLAAIAFTIVMYIFFAHKGCSMNQSAITVNILLVIITSGISVHPVVQESNSRAGLAQSAMVSFYCTYLTLSAVGMEPDDQHCNPLVRANGTRKATVVLGAIITFLTVAYTTTRAATYGLALGGNGQRGNQARYSRLAATDDSDAAGSEHGMSRAVQPDSRREMRANALQAAVESGALPSSALDDTDDSDSDDSEDDSDNSRRSSKKKGPRDDERNGTQYNYSLFHIIFLLSTMWVATLLTTQVSEYGVVPRTSGASLLEHQQPVKGEPVDFVPVGRTYWASWVKIVSAWLCYGIYTWSLVAPVVLPERFDY